MSSISRTVTGTRTAELEGSSSTPARIPHSLTGGSSDLILKLFLRHGVRPAGWSKLPTWIGLLAKSMMGVPFRWHERFSERRVEALSQEPVPPLFVIGHWRSGTTHLHNLLTQDPQFGCLTMRHCITPNSFLTTPEFLNRKLAEMMPETRPVDGMKMGWNFPQEEEFALERMTDLSYNHCYLFPDRAEDIFRRTVLFENRAEDGVKWTVEYHKLLCRLSLDQGGKRLCLKNPPNTARIPQLLQLFPEARFVYIVRNPEHVFRSTRDLWRNVTKLLGLTKVGEQLMEQNLVLFYRLLLKSYLGHRTLIPARNLIEVKYEDLVTTPLQTLKTIYESLRIDGFSDATPRLENYLQKKAGFQKSEHYLDSHEVAKIRQEWEFAFSEWGYDEKSWCPAPQS
ncbi:MAG: sulfotransferase [Planctomycetaceae bacterium]|nr:sulfotransferase [Planctomycetaceae bacterium]